MIVDYWGRVLAELPEGEGIVTADIDLAAQAEARRKFRRCRIASPRCTDRSR